MHSIVAQFCKQCGICAPTKDSTQHAHRPLQPWPVLPVRFYSYTLEFVNDLPPAQGFNCVLTIVDCLTKFMRLIPYTMGEEKLLAAQVTKLPFENTVRFFGVPKELVHDRDPRFMLIFGMNYGVFLALKPVPPQHFTLRVMGKVSAPIACLNTSYMCKFITNLCQHS